MNQDKTRWVLAFDASCGTCRQIASAVADAAAKRLEVLPLADPEVRSWRERAFGTPAPWKPTLLRIRGDQVRGWIGTGVPLSLVRRLGPGTTIRVLRSLGQLRRAGDQPRTADGKVIGRAGFLRIGAGTIVAAGIVLAGRTPAFAEQSCEAARKWVEANRDRLPESYSAIVEYPMVYRKAIYNALPAEAKSRFWMSHLERHLATRQGLSAQQAKVVDNAMELAGKPATFEPGHRPEDAARALSDAAVAAFGKAESRTLFATLGPKDASTSTDGGQSAGNRFDCYCSDQSDYCDDGCGCFYQYVPCNFVDGCGFLGLYVCNGVCVCG